MCRVHPNTQPLSRWDLVALYCGSYRGPNQPCMEPKGSRGSVGLHQLTIHDTNMLALSSAILQHSALTSLEEIKLANLSDCSVFSVFMMCAQKRTSQSSWQLCRLAWPGLACAAPRFPLTSSKESRTPSQVFPCLISKLSMCQP